MDFSFTKEQLMFKKEIIRFAKKEIVPRVQEHDLKKQFDFEAFKKLGEFGILGLHFPEEFGGSGADVITTVLAGEALGEAGVDGGLTLAYGAHTFLCADTIFSHGTDAQRKKYIPKLASGEWIGCMGLTEPNAGSDVRFHDHLCRQKRGQIRLKRQQNIHHQRPYCRCVGSLRQNRTREKNMPESRPLSLKKALRDSPPAPNLIKMGVSTSQTSELFFNNCEIPAENLLGNEGEGFNMSLQTVEWDRSALLAPFVGAATYMMNRCVDYAKNREQFGRKIGQFQAMKQKIANIRIFGEAARNLVYRIAWCKDQGRPMNHLEAAVAKLFVGDWSLAPSNDAVVLFGGYGYCHEYDMERIFRDSRLAPIGGGTSDIQKMIISKLM